MDIADVMLRTNIEKLSLVPAGQLHDRCTELLASTRMSELISDLAGRYQDRILIFDSPPILATSESVVLTSLMGQIVRSDVRRVGKECVRPCRSRWSPCH